ncbi:MAG: hypothetical protein VX430_03670, partial [Pseudomonadota bacterium]|nr:hypothetical protein [Pseudomonadota bacterium]
EGQILFRALLELFHIAIPAASAKHPVLVDLNSPSRPTYSGTLTSKICAFSVGATRFIFVEHKY